MKIMTRLIMGIFVLTFCGLGINLTGCKKKSSNSTSSGGGPSGELPNPYSGNSGQLSGTWTGVNSSGGQLTLNIYNGFINGYDNQWQASSSALGAKKQQFKAKSFTDSIPIDPKTGVFSGSLGTSVISGNFNSYTSASGKIHDGSDSHLPDLTWTAKIQSSSPSGYQLRIDVNKIDAGVVDANTAVRICEDGEGRCNADFAPGTSVTLTASSVSPLYTFEGWGTGVCSAFGKGSCQLTMTTNFSLDMYNAFQEINIDGIYIGTTEQGENITLSVAKNIVKATAQIKTGTGQCVFDLSGTDTYPVLYLSKELFFAADVSGGDIDGGFTSATAANGFITFDSSKIPGTSAACSGSEFVSYQIGGGSASASASSLALRNTSQMKAKRLQVMQLHHR